VKISKLKIDELVLLCASAQEYKQQSISELRRSIACSDQFYELKAFSSIAFHLVVRLKRMLVKTEFPKHFTLNLSDHEAIILLNAIHLKQEVSAEYWFSVLERFKDTINKQLV